jgi:hypothetical protein
MASTNAYGECLCDSRIEAGRRDIVMAYGLSS